MAYDNWSSEHYLEAIEYPEAFGLNRDPSHMMWQGIDPVAYITEFAERKYHLDCTDSRLRTPN